MSGWQRYDRDARRITLNVHVQPQAARDGVAGLYGDALKIRIAAPAVDDKANRALIAFLRAALGLRAAQIAIRHGARSRRKTVEISDADDALAARLRALLPA
jgi:uncharacterized protein (TIGR00251 family)